MHILCQTASTTWVILLTCLRYPNLRGKTRFLTCTFLFFKRNLWFFTGLKSICVRWSCHVELSSSPPENSCQKNRKESIRKDNLDLIVTLTLYTNFHQNEQHKWRESKRQSLCVCIVCVYVCTCVHVCVWSRGEQLVVIRQLGSYISWSDTRLP